MYSPLEVLEVRRSGRQRRADHRHGQRHRRERQQNLKNTTQNGVIKIRQVPATVRLLLR